MSRDAREHVIVAAALVTQINCEAVLGIDARRYLERVLPLCRGHVISIGKLRAVPVAVALAKLQELPSSDEPTPLVLEDEPTSADDVLRRIGMRRSA